MKPIQIVAVDDERTVIPFSVPVKGRRPLVVNLPRFDFIPEDDFDQLTANIEALDKEELPLRKYSRKLALVMLQQFVSDKDYAALETLATGQLDQILTVWREHSQVSLGESVASADSSTESTEAQSDSTSSADSDTAA